MPAKTKFEIKLGPATREAFGRALVELGRENKDIVVCDADLSKSTMTTYFAKEFPERFFSFGIAESNMVAAGCGMAYAGKIPFVGSFSEPECKGSRDAQRYLDRRRRPLADERRGDRAGVLAGQLRRYRAIGRA